MNNANFTQPNYNVITSVPKEIFVVVSSADISLCLLVANITLPEKWFDIFSIDVAFLDIISNCH